MLGLIVVAAINGFGPTLTASRSVSLTAPADAGILLTGFGLALLGGLLAGAAGGAPGRAPATRGRAPDAGIGETMLTSGDAGVVTT